MIKVNSQYLSLFLYSLTEKFIERKKREYVELVRELENIKGKNR